MARFFILRADIALSFSGVTFVFVLFRLRLCAFIEATGLHSIVLCSSICMRPDSSTQLPNNCLRPFLLLFLSCYVSLEMSLLPSISVSLNSQSRQLMIDFFIEDE